MKFKIFWIDDSLTWVKSIKSEVEDAFNDLGLIADINEYQETNSAKKDILNSYADLIMIDCNLPKTSGDELIKDLRQSRCFAHIVFYSQDVGNLDRVTEDKHFLHVTSREDISSTIETVADQAYRKYKHPAFMRGLLLSEFIDLENLMEDLIVQSFKDQGEYFRHSVIHSGGESFSFGAKLKFICKLIKEASSKDESIKTKTDEISFTTSSFQKNILSSRNVLAHAYPDYSPDSGEIELISPIKNVSFTSDWFHKTRESIHEFKVKIRSLQDLDLVQFVELTGD